MHVPGSVVFGMKCCGRCWKKVLIWSTSRSTPPRNIQHKIDTGFHAQEDFSLTCDHAEPAGFCSLSFDSENL